MRRVDRKVDTLKITFLIDTQDQAILDVHCSAKWPTDAKIGPQLAARNIDQLTSLAADKGYDSAAFRRQLRENDVRPLIKHRLYRPIDRAHNARLNEDRYNQRSLAESVNSAVKRAILDVHCATTKPHDTKIGWQVLRRDLSRISTITADKGYDWSDLRTMLRESGVRPVIKHREFDSLDVAHNARLDDEVYHRRSVVETVFRVLKQRYGDRLCFRNWYRQFREFTLKCAVKNIDDSLSFSPA